jgi:hypothetical protein
MNELISKYKQQLIEIRSTEDSILELLRLHYTDELLSNFKIFDDFLEDINCYCESSCLAKLMFISEIKYKYENNI